VFLELSNAIMIKNAYKKDPLHTGASKNSENISTFSVCFSSIIGPSNMAGENITVPRK
jgi:hypothetical protein